jgi:hypothetical protein
MVFVRLDKQASCWRALSQRHGARSASAPDRSDRPRGLSCHRRSPTTVGRWARGHTEAFGPGEPRPRAPQPRPRQRAWRPPDARSYAYLLGLYLGDGCLAHRERTIALQLSLDSVYPEIIEDAVAAIVLTLLGGRARVRRVRESRCMTVTS